MGAAVQQRRHLSTTDTLAVEKGDYVKYVGAYYRITEIQPHDSHTLYLCKAVSR